MRVAWHGYILGKAYRRIGKTWGCCCLWTHLLDTLPVLDLLQPQLIVLGLEGQQTLPLLKQERMRIAKGLHRKTCHLQHHNNSCCKLYVCMHACDRPSPSAIPVSHLPSACSPNPDDAALMPELSTFPRFQVATPSRSRSRLKILTHVFTSCEKCFEGNATLTNSSSIICEQILPRQLQRCFGSHSSRSALRFPDCINFD